MPSKTGDLNIVKDSNIEEEEKEKEGEDNQRHPEGDKGQLFMSLHDLIRPPPPPLSPPPGQSPPPEHHLAGQLLDEISSPLNVQIFDLCNPDIFSDTLQNCETTSSPNGCSFKDQNSSYVTSLSLPPSITIENGNNNNINKFTMESLDISNFLGDQNYHNTSTTSSTTTTATTVTPPGSFQNQTGSLSIIFDSQDDIDDISASIDFSPSSPFSCPTPYTINPTNNTQIQDQYPLPLADVALNNGIPPYPNLIEPAAAILPLISGGPPANLGTVFEKECLSPILPFLRLNPSNSSSSSCSLLDPTIGSFLPGNLNHGLGAADNSSIFPGSLLMGSDLQAKELDFQGDNATVFCADQLPLVYDSAGKQAFSNESSQLVSAASSAPLATEISSLEDSSFKVGKLSVEQRKEKIHRYLKKRNERNFSKKIKYACRKTLADSRPRVRGRFAKNDDFVENHHRHINGHHEDDDYDDVAVKEEDELADSSDIFSHISGVNSFKCNYQIQSWI